MAAAKRFKPIVIKSLEQLNTLAEHICNGPGEQVFKNQLPALYEAIDPANPSNILKKWLDAHHMGVCANGERKILAAAGKVGSWLEYLTLNWGNQDGVRAWFSDYCKELGVTLPRGSYYFRTRQDDPQRTPFNTFAECLAYNKKLGVKVKWVKFPFPKKAKRRAKR